MQITKENLIEIYSNMDTEELLDLCMSNNLTNNAENAIQTVLAGRELSNEERQTMNGKTEYETLPKEQDVKWDAVYKDKLNNLKPEQMIAAMFASHINNEQIIVELVDMGMPRDVAESLVNEISSNHNKLATDNRLQLYKYSVIFFATICMVSLSIHRFLDSPELINTPAVLCIVAGLITVVLVLLMGQEVKKKNRF